MAVPPFLETLRCWLQRESGLAIRLLSGDCGTNLLVRFEEAFLAVGDSLSQGGGNRIVIAESNEIEYLVLLFACMANDAAVFVCNPGWGDLEWQQAAQLIQPHHYLGNAVPEIKKGISAATLDSHSPAQIAIPTGGTSGILKFASHTWSSLYVSAKGFQQHFTPESAIAPIEVHSLCCLPLFHVSGLMQVIRAIASNGSVMFGQSKQFLAGDYCHSSLNNTFVSLVPTQLHRALESPSVSAWLQSSRAILLGGAPAWPDLINHARQLHLPLAPTYGTTETAAQVATLKPVEFLEGQDSCAQVLPHVQIQILDNNDHPLTANQVGRIAITSTALASGYFPHSFSSDQPWTSDDIGYLDSEGYLYVLGRNSDTILTGGESVFPLEVETAIRATGFVQDVAVIGLADPEWGQKIVALCVSADQSSFTDLFVGIAEALKGQLARYKHPKMWLLVESIPTNSRGKRDRQSLQSLAEKATPLSPKI